MSLFIIAIAIAAWAQDAKPADPPSPPIVVEGQRPDENRRVCITSAHTGTIIRKKVCKTTAQWQAERAASKRALDGEVARQAQEQLRLVGCLNTTSIRKDC